MSTSTTYEIATLYGALDSDAATDGDSLSAHVLRAIAMSHNRMVTKSAPWANMIWPVTSTIPTIETSPVAPPGLCVVPVVDSWTMAVHGLVIPKMPGHNFADAKIYIRADLATTVYATIATSAAPINSARTTSHALVASCAGDATWRTLTISNIPVSQSDTESMALFLRSPATSVLGSTANFGTPNSWTMATELKYPEPRIVYGPTTATWNLTANLGDSWAEHAHVLRALDGSGDDVVAPRVIVYVTQQPASTAPELHIMPTYSMGEIEMIIARGVTWQIEKVQRASVGNVSLITRYA